MPAYVAASLRRCRGRGLLPLPAHALPYLHISGFRVADSEKALIFGHFLHSATRKGQFGVSRCFDSSLGICVDTVAHLRGRGWTRTSLRIFVQPPTLSLPQPAAGLPASGKNKSDQTPAGRGLVGGGNPPSSRATAA